MNSLFLNNKYTKYYFNIISNATQQKRVKSKEQYFEKHHIIPRSLNGNDEQQNIVLLTGREHFICHWLLTKMLLDNSKMIYALRCMSFISSDHQGHRYKTKITSRVFSKLKEEFSKTHSKTMTGRPSWNKGKKLGPQSNEHKLKNSLSNKGKRLGISPGNKGKPQPEYIKDKKRKPKPKVTCPHCQKEGGISAMMRWHFDNCGVIISSDTVIKLQSANYKKSNRYNVIKLRNIRKSLSHSNRRLLGKLCGLGCGWYQYDDNTIDTILEKHQDFIYHLENK